ncbi:MAG: hypothetical protein WB763_24085 [Terriglobia bacterium]|jgi:hypothetical protein
MSNARTAYRGRMLVETVHPDKNLRDLDLNGLFQRLTVAYSDLSSPPKTALEHLNSELERARRKEDTLIYIAAISAAVSVFAIFPVLLVGGFRLVRSVEPAVEHLLRQRNYLVSHPEMGFAAAAASFSASFYTLVLHQRLARHLAGRFPRLGLWTPRDIDRTGLPFIFLAVLLNYAALGVGLLFLCSYSAPGTPWTTWAVTAWMCVPLPVTSLVPSYLLMFVFTYPHIRYELYDDAPQATLLRELLLLLDYLQDIADSGSVSSERRRTIMRRIGRIADMLRRLCSTKGTRHTSVVGVYRRIGQAADHFLALSSCVAFPREDTLPELKRNVVTYANIVAGGTYDALPTSEAGESEGLTKGSHRMAMWRRAGGLLGLFLVVALPLAVYAELVTHFRVEIPANLDPTAGVVYSGWVALCLLAYIDKLAPDAKAALIDVIKLVFRR